VNKLKFRIASVLIGLAAFLGGAVGIRAQCGGGCNYGTLDGCYTISGCSGSDVCEQDICLNDNCYGQTNHFQFCVYFAYVCHYPSCSYEPLCYNCP
jgi:hypothetical protein